METTNTPSDIEIILNAKSRSTTLVTYIVKEGFNNWQSTRELTNEISTSINIKDKTTRKYVQDALRYIIRHLQNVDTKMCKNGIAYFVGHELSSTGNINFIDKIIVPDIPIRKDIYLCGKHFFPEEIIKLHNDFED